MCGIAGFITAGDCNSLGDQERLLASMSNTIAHRGPDDDGSWSDLEKGVWLGHRRLAIVDLSSAGHQPMKSASGRYLIVFNGEIYNHLPLRQEMEAAGEVQTWYGHSDTETLLHSIEIFGIHKTLQKLSGMFAIAVWDQKLNKLTIARDRFGEKPLYYGWIGQTFIFCSELKSIKKCPNFKNTIDRIAILLIL